MGNVQTILTPAGEELVVLDRRDYDALRARAGDERAEDAMTTRVVAASKARLAAGSDVALPATVWESIEAGEHPVKVLRRHRDLTQVSLGKAAGLTQGYIATIEARDKQGSPRSLKAIARALGVPIDVLMEG